MGELEDKFGMSEFEKSVADFFKTFAKKPNSQLLELGLLHVEEKRSYYPELRQPEKILILYRGFRVEIFKKKLVSYKNLIHEIFKWNPRCTVYYSTVVSKDGMYVFRDSDREAIVKKAMVATWKRQEKFLKDFEKEVRDIVDTDDDSESTQQSSDKEQTAS